MKCIFLTDYLFESEIMCIFAADISNITNQNKWNKQKLRSSLMLN